jgi:hypothetical protein
MSSKFEVSQQPGGTHFFLAQLAGTWIGTSRTWFEPDQLADESPISGTIRSVLGGRFLLHEYEGVLCGQRVEGIALHGYDLAEERFLTAWVDSCHNGSTIMLSAGERGAWPGPASVLGSYPDGQGGPRWGWRTTVDLPEPDRLLITHYNITPDGSESKAVEWDYRRAGQAA